MHHFKQILPIILVRKNKAKIPQNPLVNTFNKAQDHNNLPTEDEEDEEETDPETEKVILPQRQDMEDVDMDCGEVSKDLVDGVDATEVVTSKKTTEVSDNQQVLRNRLESLLSGLNTVDTARLCGCLDVFDELSQNGMQSVFDDPAGVVSVLKTHVNSRVAGEGK